MTKRERQLAEYVAEDCEPGKAMLLDMMSRASDDALMMSVMHCHAFNISSIVLEKREDGSLTRAFLAWPGHRLHMGIDTVGAHDHRYPLTITGLRGVVMNDTWKEGSGRYSSFFWKWSFDSYLAGGAGASFVGESELYPVSSNVLTPGRSVSLRAEDIHSMYCHGGAAAWLVEEGKAERHCTSLFTARARVEARALYRHFGHEEEVREHVREFIDMRWPG